MTRLWSIAWRSIVWVVVYEITIRLLGVEGTSAIFWLCIITSAAENLLWYAMMPADRQGGAT